MEQELKNHFEEDKVNFAAINARFLEQDEIHREMAKTLNHIAKQMQPPTEEEKKKQQEEFDERIEQAMKKAIYGGSQWGYKALIVTAVIVGSLITIFGGFKWFLGIIGFTRVP